MPTHAICRGPHGLDAPHCPLLLYAGGHGDGDGDGAPFNSVQAEQGLNGYELTNFYLDGTKGVSDEAMLEAEVDESPCCTCCSCEPDHWQHDA